MCRKENERSVDNRETFGELFNTKTENKHADAMANGRVNINNKLESTVELDNGDRKSHTTVQKKY